MGNQDTIDEPYTPVSTIQASGGHGRHHGKCDSAIGDDTRDARITPLQRHHIEPKPQPKKHFMLRWPTGVNLKSSLNR